jgi:hypothetical protein
MPSGLSVEILKRQVGRLNKIAAQKQAHVFETAEFQLPVKSGLRAYFSYVSFLIKIKRTFCLLKCSTLYGMRINHSRSNIAMA